MGFQDLAVCRKPKSHTVMGFQDLAVCKKPDSHTVMGFQDLAVCRKPKSHTVTAVRDHAVCRTPESHTDDVVVRCSAEVKDHRGSCVGKCVHTATVIRCLCKWVSIDNVALGRPRCRDTPFPTHFRAACLDSILRDTFSEGLNICTRFFIHIVDKVL
jgi:hypothetical protein